MYAAPPSITAEVFAVIPDAIGYGDQRSDWADVQINGAPTPTYLEGPCFDGAGNLWVTDIPWGRLPTFSGHRNFRHKTGAEPQSRKWARKLTEASAAILAGLQ